MRKVTREISTAGNAATLNLIYWYQIKITLLCQTRWCQDNNECQGREVMPANPNEESQTCFQYPR